MNIAKDIPLFKSGSTNYFNNYRPISLLPQLSKMLEKLYSNRLNIFSKTCDILNHCQYGFNEKVFTTHALVKVVSVITNSLNKRKHYIGVFIDLQHTFDTADHQLVCTKLELYGFRGVAYQWIEVIYQKERNTIVMKDINPNFTNITWCSSRFYLRSAIVYNIC